MLAVGESISYSTETIGIVNRFNLYIWSGMLLLLILLSALYTARIVKPLAQLNETAKSIADLSFVHADIRTGDEIESLADSINKMSDKLKASQHSLEVRNTNLRTFITDVSHELKTPLSLIQAYAGIQDGLDDGTFAEVIKRQSEEMGSMISQSPSCLSRRRSHMSLNQRSSTNFQPQPSKIIILFSVIRIWS